MKDSILRTAMEVFGDKNTSVVIHNGKYNLVQYLVIKIPETQIYHVNNCRSLVKGLYMVFDFTFDILQNKALYITKDTYTTQEFNCGYLMSWAYPNVTVDDFTRFKPFFIDDPINDILHDMRIPQSSEDEEKTWRALLTQIKAAFISGKREPNGCQSWIRPYTPSSKNHYNKMPINLTPEAWDVVVAFTDFFTKECTLDYMCDVLDGFYTFTNHTYKTHIKISNWFTKWYKSSAMYKSEIYDELTYDDHVENGIILHHKTYLNEFSVHPDEIQNKNIYLPDGIPLTFKNKEVVINIEDNMVSSAPLIRLLNKTLTVAIIDTILKVVNYASDNRKIIGKLIQANIII